jgi:hypothetical protein
MLFLRGQVLSGRWEMMFSKVLERRRKLFLEPSLQRIRNVEKWLRTEGAKYPQELVKALEKLIANKEEYALGYKEGAYRTSNEGDRLMQRLERHLYLTKYFKGTAWNDFGWEIEDIVTCLLKLNDKYHDDNPQKNHFYKADRNLRVSKKAMDFYKAKQIMEERDVYTHLYLNEETGKVIISSFKEL